MNRSYMDEGLAWAGKAPTTSSCGTPIHRSGVLALIMLFTFLATAPADEFANAIEGIVTIDAGRTSVPLDLSRTVLFLDAHPNLLPHNPQLPRPEISQESKRFVPNLLVVSKGTTVDFPNRDPFSHNVFSRSKSAQFDLDRYPQGVSKSYTFDQVGMVQIFCNIHPNMRALIMVVPNRHFVQADAKGRYRLPNVPPGRYSLITWNERTGSVRNEISVAPQGVVRMDVKLQAQPAASRSRQRRHQDGGVAKGLGVKREQLNLPVVRESHPDQHRRQ